MTELKKDVARIMQIVKGEGVKERVFSAKSSWYEWSKEERELKAKIESIFERKLMTLFFDLEESLKRLPSQSEYLNEYMKIAFAKIKKEDWYTEIVKAFNQDFIKSCVTWRADRAYKSSLIEIMTAAQLESKGYTVFREKYLDMVMGVDLVAVKGGKVWYIHVTKDSTFSKDKVLKKGTYRDYWINYKRFNYQRDFRNHVELFYSADENENNVVKNGLPLFKFDYVLDALDEQHSFKWDDNNQMAELMAIMKQAGSVSKFYQWKSTNGKLTVK
ncbi:MAG: hypothetical protein LKF39_06665 [Lactococcus raffinolactis]|jgi:hypothetical protein|nr:hypothetical protein [Lactococcus raffinolactis]